MNEQLMSQQEVIKSMDDYDTKAINPTKVINHIEDRFETWNNIAGMTNGNDEPCPDVNPMAVDIFKTVINKLVAKKSSITFRDLDDAWDNWKATFKSFIKHPATNMTVDQCVANYTTYQMLANEISNMWMFDYDQYQL